MSLKHVLNTTYQQSFDGEWSALTGGYECALWKVVGDDGPWVVRVCPSWRTDDEIAWIYDLVTFCAQHLPAVVAPIKNRRGELFFRHNDHPIVVFPFVEGSALDRTDDDLLVKAGDMLARLHTIARSWPEQRPRPPSHTSAPKVIPRQNDPNALVDRQLDAWLASNRATTTLTEGIMHGDFYAANILCRGGDILGVLDWDECRKGPVIEEIAWATWEFCKTPSGDDLDLDRSQMFLDAYRKSNQTVGPDEYRFVIPMIRDHLRYEVRRSLAAEEAGDDWDQAYREQEIRAFAKLSAAQLSAT